MIRKQKFSTKVEISNPNFMSNMDDVLHNTIKLAYDGKFVSNYIILNSKILHRGLASPDLRKGIIAVVDVMLEFDILLIPQHCILSNCVYISSEADDGNIDQTYHMFQLENDNLTTDILNKIMIVVANNGLSADNIRKLENLSPGDVIPLFVVSSTVYPAQGKIACIAIPNFDDRYSPVFKFTQKMLDSGKFNNLAKGKLSPDKYYKLVGGNFIDIKSTQASVLFDFLDEDQLVEYISTLASL